MTETQEHLLALLSEFDELCRKYNIEYYLAGGCLIGALRNEGFLPWDDDADVHMSHANAVRLIEALEKEGIKDRCVYIKSDNGDYMNVHWRYENTASTFLMRGLTGSSGAQGQFIDIFLYYPLSNDEEEQQKTLHYFELYKELKSQNTSVISVRSREYLRDYYKFKRIEKLIGKKNVLKYIEKRIFEFPEEGAEYVFLCCPTPPKHQVPSSWWGRPRYIPFENTKLPVPEYAEKFIAYEYGPNWFEVPPYGERMDHVFVKDFDIPYTVYTSEYNKHIDIKQFYASEVEKKEFWFDILYDRNYINPHIRTLQGLRTSMEIQKTVNEQGLDLKKMVDEGEEAELEIIFRPYFNLINSEGFRYWKTYVDMPDAFLYAALYHSCFNGRYGLARRILGQRRTEVERPLSEDLQRLCDICDMIDELFETRYGDCNIEKARELSREFYGKEPDVLTFIREEMSFQIAEAKESLDSLLNKCENYLERFPGDGELLKLLGDILLAKGDKSEAEKYYLKAYYTTNHGYTLNSIRKYFEKENPEILL